MANRPMVGCSTGAMNALLDKLTKLKNHSVLKDLQKDLESLNDCLDKFAGGRETDAQVKVWKKQVRELVYDIEDWIEPKPPPNLGESEIKQIEEFKAQINEARERCERYDLLRKAPISDANPADVRPSKVTIDSRPLWEKTVLVAVDDPKKELEEHLMNKDEKLKVVSIVGMEGHGKTTLAKEIYGKLQGQFECQAFVSVGRRPSMRTTLMDILRQVKKYHTSHDVQGIITELWEFLGTKRYFILIDGIWSTWDWKVINCALPDKNRGSRVLTTTCIMDVAESCSIHTSDVIYQVKALSETDSRSLFDSRMSVPEEKRPVNFKEVSDDMLKLCSGMPLAVIVTAGLLAWKSAELGPSKGFENTILSAKDQYSTSQGMRKILYISYSDLSLPVKSCFMYLRVFPENRTIKKDCLIRLWVAEGFIPKREEESLWETGESYLNELISRRLIQPVFDYDDGQAVGCTVHGVILDFIASLSREDNFVTTGAELRAGSFPRDTIRRFSFDCSNKDEDDTLASSTVHLSRVRSLIFFGDVKGMPGEILHLRFLRVLDLEDADDLRSHHLKGIEGLVLLRYLGLGGTLFIVPPEMASLKKLTHLRIQLGVVAAVDLRVLRALPKLILLDLHSKYPVFERLIISDDGFPSLEVFCYTCGYSSGMGLQFTPGAMPQLRSLRFETEPQYGDFDFGIQHISCLSRVHATLRCRNARDLESADAAEAAIRDQVSKNPNSPILELKREEPESLQESYKIRYVPTETMDFATGAMGSLLNKLGELLKEEYKLQKGVREQVQSFSRELEIMQAALHKVAEVPREQLDEQVKLWARDVRELSYDMEDIVDTILVRVEDGRDTTPNLHWLKKLMEKMGKLFKAKTHHQIANAIKDINKKVQEVANRRGRFTVDSIVANPAATSTIDPRLLALYKEAAQLVGIDGPRDALINMLSNGDNVSNKEMKIVSVIGFGGLGKTTLAKAVYEKLKVGFDCCAFVSVGQKPDMKKVFKDILIDLDKQKYTNFNMTMLDERQLMVELREFLQMKRYFIITDDIWDKKSWEIIRGALADSNCGSRVVATTRISEVATIAGDIFKLEPLSRDNSEILFNTRIVDCEGKHPHNQSTEVYDKILKKCGGVPLAIITIASLLASKPVEDWSEVYNSIGFGNGDNDVVENSRKILSFSYYDLPSPLKTCLLYLSVFPGDYQVDKYLLIWKWIAEGFVHDEQGRGLLKVGEGYFKELVNRSLIKPDEICTGYVDGCHIHDMVLDLIRSLSREENFVTILDNERQTFSQSNARRLALHKRIEEHNPQANMGVQHVRSFTAILCDIGMISPSFQVLRVLAIENCDFMEGYNSLDHLGNLLHLRYLGLQHTPVRELPKEIGDLKFLQTLVLTGTGIEELPSSISLLTQLVCLRADDKTRAPDWIGNLTSLQELWIEPTANRSARFVKELGNLRELRLLRTWIDVRDESLERALVESLGKLHKVQLVSIYGKALGKGAMWEIGPVSPGQLCYLNIECLEFSRLPVWINSSHLPNLSNLSVNVQVVQEQDMETLGRLPQLHELMLWSRYTPVVGIISGDGQLFRKLRFFKTNMCIRFVHSKCSMPSLEALEFDVNVEIMKDANLGFDDLGLGSLPSIQRVTARINCRDARVAEVEEAKVALRHVAAVHPNRPTLQTVRVGEDQEPTLYNLKVVDYDFDAREQKGQEHYFNFRWLLLLNPRVEKVSVCIKCEDASDGEVEDAEEALRHAVAHHPNHPALKIMRDGEDKMMLSDQQPTETAAQQEKEKPVLARSWIDVHPNHPTLEIMRDGEDKMMLPDQHHQ